MRNRVESRRDRGGEGLCTDNRHRRSFKYLHIEDIGDETLRRVRLIQADVSNEYSKQLVAAIKKNDAKLVRSLLEQGGDPNVMIDNEPALIYVIRENLLNIFRLLIEYGADVNARDPIYGYSPIIIASGFNRLEMVRELLLKPELNVNATDNFGYNGFMYAVENGHAEVLKLLLGDGRIYINTKDDNLYNVLFRAVEKGYAKAVEVVIGIEGIDVNTREKGDTLLIRAVKNEHVEVVKVLLTHKDIDVNAIGSYGRTALMLAAMEDHTEVVKLLMRDKRIDREEAQRVAKKYRYKFE